ADAEVQADGAGGADAVVQADGAGGADEGAQADGAGGVDAAAGDDVNMEMAELMQEVGAEGMEGGNDRERNERFDRLADLIGGRIDQQEGENRANQAPGAPGGGDPDAGPGAQVEDQPQDGLQELRERVRKLRTGKLYMAVVLARELDRGRGNPMSDGKLKRFFNSKFDKIADGAKLAGAANGLLGTLDSGYKGSFVSKGIGLISNAIGLVAAIKKSWADWKKLITKKGWIDKIFDIVAFVTDLAMLLSKGVAIAKGIAGFMNKDNGKFKDVTDTMVRIADRVSQVGLITTSSKDLVDIKKKHDSLDEGEDARWAEIRPLLGDGEEEEAGKREAVLERRRVRVDRALRREDISGEDKDKLITYLAARRKIQKLDAAKKKTVSGLVAAATGLVSGILGHESETHSDNKILGTIAKSAGVASGFAGMVAPGVKMSEDSKDAKMHKNEESEMIKGRLWEHIRGLTDDDHGLMGAAEDLQDNPGDEVRGRINNVVNDYNAADRKLKGVDVNYDTLLKSANVEEFKDMLVAGI
ncbi:MAG: hypothetical protein K2N01_03560, partial [Lachnospiraceae bacterium]|nr:hypothetical protein [Lachnospiraceae bacterium]